MFDKATCYRIGQISKLHGFKGEVTVYIDADDPYEFQDLESVFVEYDKKLIPFFLERFHVREKSAVAKFEDVDTEKKAKQLVGCGLYLPLDTLPQLDESTFYFFEVENFNVVDKLFGHIGKVVKVIDIQNNPLIEIDFNGLEILLPKQDQFIEFIDRENKTLFVNAPEGLLNMYLNNEEE